MCSFAVQSDVKKEFLVSDRQDRACLTSAFFFTLCLPRRSFGWVGDRFPPQKHRGLRHLLSGVASHFLTWFGA